MKNYIFFSAKVVDEVTINLIIPQNSSSAALQVNVGQNFGSKLKSFISHSLEFLSLYKVHIEIFRMCATLSCSRKPELLVYNEYPSMIIVHTSTFFVRHKSQDFQCFFSDHRKTFSPLNKALLILAVSTNARWWVTLHPAIHTGDASSVKHTPTPTEPDTLGWNGTQTHPVTTQNVCSSHTKNWTSPLLSDAHRWHQCPVDPVTTTVNKQTSGQKNNSPLPPPSPTTAANALMSHM